MSEQVFRPPLGLRPVFFSEKDRTIEILEAMLLYLHEDRVPPTGWTEELCTRLQKLERYKKEIVNPLTTSNSI